MKTFNQLDEQSQARALETAVNTLLKKICEGSVRFSDRDIQAKIDEAAKQAERMKTPWFMHEFVMETCKDEVTRAAKVDAHRAYYREPGDLVLSL